MVDEGGQRLGKMVSMSLVKIVADHAGWRPVSLCHVSSFHCCGTVI